MARLAIVVVCALALIAGAFAATPAPAPNAAKSTASATYATLYDGLKARADASMVKQVVDANPAIANYLKNPATAITVFVPSNAAFKALATKMGVSTSVLLSNPLIKTVLYFHMINKPLTTGAMMPAGTTLPTLVGGFPPKVLKVTVGGAKPTLQGVGSSATVYLPNIKCGKSWAHGIDYPLLPLKL